MAQVAGAVVVASPIVFWLLRRHRRRPCGSLADAPDDEDIFNCEPPAVHEWVRLARMRAVVTSTVGHFASIAEKRSTAPHASALSRKPNGTASCNRW